MRFLVPAKPKIDAMVAKHSPIESTNDAPILPEQLSTDTTINKVETVENKESGKVEDFIIQCVEEHNKREKLRQERNAR